MLGSVLNWCPSASVSAQNGVVFLPNGYPICICVNICFISPCKIPFRNASVAGSYGYAKQWMITYQLIENVCTQGPSVNFSSRDLERGHQHSSGILEKSVCPKQAQYSSTV